MINILCIHVYNFVSYEAICIFTIFDLNNRKRRIVRRIGGEFFLKKFMFKKISFFVNSQAPVAQKVADQVVFRRFRGEGLEFFKIGPH